MKSKLHPCPALKPFVDYWDEFHKKWYHNVSAKPPILKSIDGWEVPPTPMWQYFPEPYWGNSYTENLVAAFLNLNPGKEGPSQNVLSSTSNPIQMYSFQKNVYHRTVEVLSANALYDTTKWCYNIRVKWLENLLIQLNSANTTKLTVENILCADLVPWHSQTVAPVVKYIKAHQTQIVANVISPITEISHCTQLKKIVFAKGAEIEHVLERIPSIPVVYRIANKFRISIFNYNGAIIIVFVGGRNMNLPNPDNKYLSPLSNINVSVAEIVKGCLSDNLI